METLSLTLTKKDLFLILREIILTIHQSYRRGEEAKVAFFMSDWKKFNQD